MPDIPTQVLAAYGITCPPAEVRALGSAGGFSGAQFWKITAPAGTFCLRRWPAEHPTREQLAWIHSVLQHVARTGFLLVPLPQPARHANTWVEHAGHLWELTPWMLGSADFRQSPTPEKLAAALHALANFHLAAANFPGGASSGVSPGVLRRAALLDHWITGGLERLAEAIHPTLWPDLYARAGRVLCGFQAQAAAVRQSLVRAATLRVPLQPCLRDIWHDHVLFDGNTVTGLLDFGALACDTVACDVGRLLGSLAHDDRKQWGIGLAAYQQLRPLGEAERQLVAVFDRSTVLLGGLNWLEWIYVERRQFADPTAVIQRIDEILSRLEWFPRSACCSGGLIDGDSP